MVKKEEKAGKAVKEEAKEGRTEKAAEKAVKAGKEAKEARTEKIAEKGAKEKASGKGKAKKAKAAPKAKSSNPYDWIEFKANDIEEIIVNLSNSGLTESQIGLTLRDQYGIPATREVLGKSITTVLKEKNLLHEIPTDLLNLIRRSVKLQKHMEQYKKDMTAKRGYQLTVSKIRRLVYYYHKKKMLPEGWRYTPDTAALLVK